MRNVAATPRIGTEIQHMDSTRPSGIAAFERSKKVRR